MVFDNIEHVVDDSGLWGYEQVMTICDVCVCMCGNERANNGENAIKVSHPVTVCVILQSKSK